MRKKEIMAILSFILVSGGFVVKDIHNYNTQSEVFVKSECIKIDSPIEKVEKLSKECEEHKRQEYVNQKVEELRAEKERIRLEEERKRQEDELRRQQEEQQRLQQEQANQVANRGGEIPSGRAINIEVSYYCGCNSCTPGGGITASGKQVSEGMIACPSNIPFNTKILIDGVVYTCEDRGGFIQYTSDGTMRVDIYTESHQTALERGRYRTTGVILN